MSPRTPMTPLDTITYHTSAYIIIIIAITFAILTFITILEITFSNIQTTYALSYWVIDHVHGYDLLFLVAVLIVGLVGCFGKCILRMLKPVVVGVREREDGKAEAEVAVIVGIAIDVEGEGREM